MVIVTGPGPQLNVMTPPAATAATTAADVQLAGVPLPITWSGWLVSAASPAGGTTACPSGLPEAGKAPPALVAGTGDAVSRGAAVPGVRGAVAGAWATAEATATGAPGAATVAAARGTVPEEVPGVAAHAVTAVITRQPIPARPHKTPRRPRIDPMAHDASPVIPLGP